MHDLPDPHSAPIAQLTRRGPHPVGVTTLELPDPEHAGRRLPTDVWYPARSPGELEADHPFGRPHAAHVDAPPAEGPRPLVAFSHGSSGLRRQSTFLTTHLASWGCVVVAPDHTGNTFFEMLKIESEDERRRVHLESCRNRPRDLDNAIDAVLAGGHWPAVDPARIGALGHSFGGWTVCKMPARGRVRAVCGLAPASEPFVGRKAFEPGELPFRGAQPVLLVAGIEDVLVDLETSVRPLFDRMAGPRALVGLRDADHFHFCDGIELLHGMHWQSPRPDQPRPTRPFGEVLDEERSHRSLCAVVTRFLLANLAPDPTPGLDDLSDEALAAVDPALQRVDR
ncbi:MAG: alpha/beta hydrolase family protein [Myxococcota bacterium]